MKRTVFISHSSADRAIAERLCAYLEQNGVTCWMAPRDVTPGKNYGAAIVDAIDECRVFVLLLSGNSNKSRQVVREVERAASSDSVILPFRIEDVQPSRDLAFYVSAAHWLDAAKYPVDEQFDELLTAIRDWQTAGGDEAVIAPAPPAPPAPHAPPPLPVSPASAPVPMVPSKRLRFPWWLALLAAAVVVIIGAVIFFAMTGKGRVNGTTASLLTPPSPSPMATPAPTPEPSATVEEPSPTEAPPTPAETPSPIASPVSTPVRLKPGVRLRPVATPNAETATAPVPPPPPPSPSETPAAMASQPAVVRPIVREVAASSQLGKEYRPNYAFDGNPATGWEPKGTGTEQTLFAHFKTPTLIRSVSILNGSGRDEEHYRAGNRVKTLRIVLSDGSNQLLTFKDEMRMQRFELQKPVTASWVKFEIVSIFPGSKINHTGIAEIVFNEQ